MFPTCENRITVGHISLIATEVGYFYLLVNILCIKKTSSSDYITLTNILIF